MSFIESQREICTTSGTSGPGGGPVRTTSHISSTRPGDPSIRSNTVSPGVPAIRPTWVRIASTVASSRSWFFGANGSIDGQITESRSGDTHSGANRRSENT